MMMDKKTFAWAIIIGVFVYSILVAINFERIALAMSTAPFWKMMLIYFATNLIYVMLIFGSAWYYRNRGFVWLIRALLLGLIISIGADILSSPRCSLNTDNLIDGCDSDGVGMTNSDTYFIELFMKTGASYKTSAYAYYVVFPTALLLLAFQIGGIIEIRKRIQGMMR